MKETTKARIKKCMPYVTVGCLALLVLCIPQTAHAADTAAATAAAEAMIEGILKVVKLICNVVGILFAIVGIVKFVIAHANEQGPEQQKAAVMMATGLVLVLLGLLVLDTIPWTDMLSI